MESQSQTQVETKNIPVSSPTETKVPQPSETCSSPNLETKKGETKKEYTEEELQKHLEDSKNMLITAYAQGCQLHTYIRDSLSELCKCLISDVTDEEKVKELRKLILKQKTNKVQLENEKILDELLTSVQVAYLRDNIEECGVAVLQYAEEVLGFGRQMKEVAKVLRSDSSAEKKVEKVSDLLM